MSEPTNLDAYRTLLRAVLLRQGGSLEISAEEMPEKEYTIMWRITEEGGLEAKLEDGGTRQ